MNRGFWRGREMVENNTLCGNQRNALWRRRDKFQNHSSNHVVFLLIFHFFFKKKEGRLDINGANAFNSKTLPGAVFAAGLTTAAGSTTVPSEICPRGSGQVYLSRTI